MARAKKVTTETEVEEVKASSKPTKESNINKDGLVKGSIVSEADYWRVKNAK